MNKQRMLIVIAILFAAGCETTGLDGTHGSTAALCTFDSPADASRAVLLASTSAGLDALTADGSWRTLHRFDGSPGSFSVYWFDAGGGTIAASAVWNYGTPGYPGRRTVLLDHTGNVRWQASGSGYMDTPLL